MAAQKITLSKAAQAAALKAAASKWHIDVGTLTGVYGTESGFGTNLGPSSAGAVGPFQFEPATARSYNLSNPFDFVKSADAAAHYLHDLGADGNVNSAATARALNSYSGGGGQTYINTVKKNSLGGNVLPVNLRDVNPALLKTVPPDVAAGGVLGPTNTAIAKTTIGAATSMLELVKAIWNTLSDPKTWMRIGLGLGGLILGFFAIKQLTSVAAGGAA